MSFKLQMNWVELRKFRNTNTTTGWLKTTLLQCARAVFQCEAHALSRASILLYDILAAPSFTGHRVIICTDSQALIKALSNSYRISKTIFKLHLNWNTPLINHYMSIKWALGHTVHYGNELADKLANIRSITQTAELEVGHPPCQPLMPISNTKYSATFSRNIRNRGAILISATTQKN